MTTERSGAATGNGNGNGAGSATVRGATGSVMSPSMGSVPRSALGGKNRSIARKVGKRQDRPKRQRLRGRRSKPADDARKPRAEMFSRKDQEVSISIQPGRGLESAVTPRKAHSRL